MYPAKLEFPRHVKVLHVAGHPVADIYGTQRRPLSGVEPRLFPQFPPRGREHIGLADAGFTWHSDTSYGWRTTATWAIAA